MSPNKLSLALLLALTQVAACSFNPTMGPLACSDDTDCSPACRCLENTVCVPIASDGFCEPMCVTGDACTLPQASGRCIEARCVVEVCDADWADCNELDVDGCEAALRHDDLHCGHCDQRCEAGEWCQEKVCTPCDDDAHCGSSCRDCAARPSNRRCLDGFCACQSETDCLPDQLCAADRCQDCIPDCADLCGGAADGCGQFCDAPCPAGTWCAGQSCIPCDLPTHCGPACVDCSQQGNNLGCAGDECGCGGDSDCAIEETCELTTHLCTGCAPDCDGLCGGLDDGCGGTCGATCPAGFRCIEAVCQPCQLDKACGPACEDCSLAAVNGSTCASVDGEWACLCQSDADCRPGSWCDRANDALGACKPCTEDDHCGPSCLECGRSLLGNACIAGQTCGCYTDSDCNSDRVCSEGTCTLVSQFDGGLDADGSPDAGDGADGGDDAYDAGIDADADAGIDADADAGIDADGDLDDGGLDGSTSDIDMNDAGADTGPDDDTAPD